ncbi:alpha/beta fold hydrolase [Chelatococcus reniformis]|uniref:2-succinyl-6-hydroxy-2,4-cyclohexadiene-1-carboxylate synthase n=1 Tax=Chelatococcus reniformis TaxID=1494448 RepID=A0A916U4E5_9HYPH|nr:alpha/beta fold hydrolase [Chelatococcus reniformis]GGC59537.1 putative 2-succinyl-6-hydroxy-2,4-cyclohexadiene-1-carboxylate synthase [Chelatococcus reniformis]
MDAAASSRTEAPTQAERPLRWPDRVMPHVEVHEGQGPYLLLVHGFLSSRAQWRSNLAGLQEVCRPVLLELWGHGRSPVPDEGDIYSIGGYIEIFETVRTTLGAERWLVCGQSFGAGLTLQYALAHSQRLAGQIFTNSMSALSAPDALGRAEDRRLRAEAIRRDGMAAIEAMKAHPRRAKRFAPAVRDELVADAARISPAGIERSVRITSGELSVMPRLGETCVPTLLVNGTWEKGFQPLRRQAATALPGLKVVDIEGGHSINAEEPDAFNAAVKAFMSSLPG